MYMYNNVFLQLFIIIDSSTLSVCEGFPSPPEQLRATQGNEPSITLQWNGSAYTGNEFPIQKYRIVIPGTNYSEEVNPTTVCNSSRCSHILTVDGRDVEFNTTYLVELTAINSCDLESIAATENVRIVACRKFTEKTHYSFPLSWYI